MNNFTINSVTSLIDEFKYNKDGSIEVKFLKQKFSEIKQKVLEIESNSTVPAESIKDILKTLHEITNYTSNSAIYIEGYIDVQNSDLFNTFGTEELNINGEYKLKKNIIITEYDEKVCLLNPEIYAIKYGTDIKIIKYSHYTMTSHIVLQVKMLTKHRSQ